MAIEYRLSYTASEINEKLGAVDTLSNNIISIEADVANLKENGADGAVLYTPQTLTDEQKKQARDNIGASRGNVGAVRYDVDDQGLHHVQQATARSNIDAAQSVVVFTVNSKGGVYTTDMTADKLDEIYFWDSARAVYCSCEGLLLRRKTAQGYVFSAVDAGVEITVSITSDGVTVDAFDCLGYSYEYTDEKIGDIDTALDSIIAIQNRLIGVITFTIGGVEYQAEYGMLWGDWASSEYNTGGYYVERAGTDVLDGVCSPSEDFVGYQDGKRVDSRDEIIAGCAYRDNL